MGAGHLMRCLALAQGWRAADREVVFLTACESPALRSRLAAAGLDVAALDHPDDWRVVAGVLAGYPGAWVALDGYHFGADDQRRIRDSGHPLLVIDDLAHLDRYHADVIVNQNLGAQMLDYPVQPGVRLLRGVEYVLLRAEFWPYRGLQRQTPDRVRRILITLGGADPDNATLKVIQALQLLSANELEVVVVAGAGSPHADRLHAAVGEANRGLPARPGRAARFTLLHNPPSMPELMAWADLAIAAGGVTAWELAFMGAPALVVTLAANQQRSIDGLSTLGVAQALGWHAQATPQSIAHAVQELLDDRPRRATMSAAGQALVDGLGVQRVIAALDRLGTSGPAVPDLHLRPATAGDAPFLWRLTNDPTVRAASFNHEPVPYQRHLEWLAGKLASPDARLWVLESGSEPVAQIRYDRKEPALAEVSFAVAAAWRGLDLGTRLLQLSGDRAGRELGVSRLRGRLFSHNVASARAFLRAGYRLVGEFEIDHTPCQAFERAAEN